MKVLDNHESRSRRAARRQELRRLGLSVCQAAAPVMVEQFFIVLTGIVSTMLASGLGATIVAGISMTETISSVVIALFAALDIGGAVLVAQFTGFGDATKANRTAAQSILSSFVLSGVVALSLALTKGALLQALFRAAEPAVRQAAYDYFSIILWSYIPLALLNMSFGILRGSGDTVTPMKASVLMNVVNVVLSAALIYGIRLPGGQTILPGFGVRGAATGLLLARTVGMVLVMIPLLRGSHGIKVNDWRMFRPDRDLLRHIMVLGVPAGAEQLMFSFGWSLTQIFIVGLGTVAIAANAIALNINSIILIPGNALCTVATGIVGRQVGAGNRREARRQLIFLAGVSMVVMLFVSAGMYLVQPRVISLYSQDTQTVAQISFLLTTIYIVQTLFWSTAFILPCGLRGAGDIRFTMTVSMLTMWFVRILVSYVLAVVLRVGVIGVWIGMYLDWVGRTIFFTLRLRGQKWFRRQVGEGADGAACRRIDSAG